MPVDRGGYTEREFALILAKAAELAEASPSGEGRTGRISLEEAKAIASEVGLDATLVERAAYLVPQVSRRSFLERMLGGPFKSDVELYFSLELTRDRAEHLLAVVRSTLGTHGKGEATAAGMSWSGPVRGGVVHASAYREGAGTRIRVAVDNRGRLVLPIAFGAMGVCAVVLVAVAAGPTGDLDPTTLAPWLILGMGLPAVGAAVWRSLRRSGRAALDALDLVVGAMGRLLDRGGAS